MFSKPACLAAALCLYAVVIWIYAPLVSGDPYHYDEADYMWAGKQGFEANYTDQNGLSFVEFVRKGLELAKNPGARQSFSEYIRTRGDIGLYRHYHGPVYAYYLATLGHLGVTSEDAFRRSGLLIHGVSAFLILLGFWSVFPSLPPVAGLAAFAVFVFDRMALYAATTITQHGIFTLLCLATLFAASRFMRDYDARWLYFTMVMVGVALCAVETAVLLFPALAIALFLDRRKVREKWPSLGSFLMLLLKCAGVLVLTILILWPFGILQLGIAKGYLTLAYMSISRRNFSPIGPMRFAVMMFEAAPWECSLLAAGGIALFLFWNRFAQRRQLLPWLCFIAIFAAVLLKITLPYPYYFAPLAASLSVACGAVFGQMWNRRGIWRAVACAALLSGIAGTTVQYSAVVRQGKASLSFEANALQLLRRDPVESGATLYVPFQLVPTLHYYFPDMKTVGYDYDVPLARLIDDVRAPGAARIMLCEEPRCREIEGSEPGFIEQRELLNTFGPTRQPFYAMRIRKPGSF